MQEVHHFSMEFLENNFKKTQIVAYIRRKNSPSQSRLDIMGDEQRDRLGSRFFQRCRRALLRVSHLVFAIFFKKAYEPPGSQVTDIFEGAK